MNPDAKNPAAFAPSELPQAASEMDSNGSRSGKQGQAVDTEELSYDFVPPKKTITVSVRYHLRGRGQPLPYPLDESDSQVRASGTCADGFPHRQGLNGPQ
jgi:hypothetical protein